MPGKGLLNVEYADILGIPFNFTAQPVVIPSEPPAEVIRVRALRPERDALEIRFPRVVGYRVELPQDRLQAEFNEDSVLELTPELVGPSRNVQQGSLARPSSWCNIWRHAVHGADAPHQAPAAL